MFSSNRGLEQRREAPWGVRARMLAAQPLGLRRVGERYSGGKKKAVRALFAPWQSCGWSDRQSLAATPLPGWAKSEQVLAGPCHWPYCGGVDLFHTVDMGQKGHKN